jgi:hypothetical protein
VRACFPWIRRGVAETDGPVGAAVLARPRIQRTDRCDSLTINSEKVVAPFRSLFVLSVGLEPVLPPPSGALVIASPIAVCYGYAVQARVYDANSLAGLCTSSSSITSFDTPFRIKLGTICLKIWA